jgi:hypothetical protein
MEARGKWSEDSQRDILLWDLAGMPGYRVAHRLNLEDTTLAVIVDDTADPGFVDRITYWETVLRETAGKNVPRILVSAMSDRGGGRFSPKGIEAVASSRGYADWIPTSAKSGNGIEELRDSIEKNIPWDRLPRSVWTDTAMRIKDMILGMRSQSYAVITIPELAKRLEKNFPSEPFSDEAVRSVCQTLAVRGLVFLLGPGDRVLLRPELVDSVAFETSRTAREREGFVSQSDLLGGRIVSSDISDIEIPERDRLLIVLSVLQRFIAYSLCYREKRRDGTGFMFPSLLEDISATEPMSEQLVVSYSSQRLSEDAFVSLAVRLAYWREYSLSFDGRSHVILDSDDKASIELIYGQQDGEPWLAVWFTDEVPIDAQALLLKYVTDYIADLAGDVERTRTYVCPACGTYHDDYKTIQARTKKGLLDIICWNCESRIPLRDLLEKRLEAEDIALAARALSRWIKSEQDKVISQLTVMIALRAIAAEAGHPYVEPEVTEPDQGFDGMILLTGSVDAPVAQIAQIESRPMPMLTERRIYVQIAEPVRQPGGRETAMVRAIKSEEKDERMEVAREMESRVILVWMSQGDQQLWMDVTDRVPASGEDSVGVELEGEPLSGETMFGQEEKEPRDKDLPHK